MKKIDIPYYRRLALLAGVVGPTLFVIIFTIEGWHRPDYNWISMFISELSLGPRGYIQIINFIFAGLCFILFAWAISTEFKEGKASKAGPILLAIIGLSLIMSGPFITDAATIFIQQQSWHGIVHGIFGALVFSLAPISCLVFYRRFRKDVSWQSLRWWTLAAAIIISAAIVFLKIAQTPTSSLNPLAGLIQREALITYFFWVFTFALSLYKRNNN